MSCRKYVDIKSIRKKKRVFQIFDFPSHHGASDNQVITTPLEMNSQTPPCITNCKKKKSQKKSTILLEKKTDFEAVFLRCRFFYSFNWKKIGFLFYWWNLWFWCQIRIQRENLPRKPFFMSHFSYVLGHFRVNFGMFGQKIQKKSAKSSA